MKHTNTFVAVMLILSGAPKVFAYSIDFPPILVPKDGTTGNEVRATGPSVTYTSWSDHFDWRPSITAEPNNGDPIPTQVQGYAVWPNHPPNNGWFEHYAPVNGPVGNANYEMFTFRVILVRNGSQENWGMRSLRVHVPGGPPAIVYQADYRSQSQKDAAPKVNFDPHEGYLVMSPVLGPSLMQIMGSGRVTDPNGPLNLNGLELQYDENGVRKSRPIELNPDGTFKFRFKDLIGDGVNGRPLIFYRRTNGDNVNVCYYGTAQQLEKRKELKEFRYDNLRHKISEAVKASGHFRYIRTNGVTMGVRG